MARYHVVPDTGVVKPCNAASSETCKYGSDALHGSTMEQAKELYELDMKGELFVGLTKDKEEEEKKETWGYAQKEFSIPEHNYEAALKKIEAANRRLMKAGIGETFEFTESKRYVQRKEVDPETGVTTEWAEAYYDIELVEPSISYGGYEFLAAMNREGKGFFVRAREGVDFGGERPEEMKCDHCGHNRPRSKTYLIKGPDGEVKQIGSTCVEAYLGVKPEGLWALEYDGLKNFTRSSGKSEPARHYKVDETLSMALAVSDGGEEFKPSSWDKSTIGDVVDLRFGGKHVNPKWRTEMSNKAAEMRDNGSVEKLKKMISEMDSNSDYAQNLKAAISEEYASPMAQNLLVSAVSIIQREERAKKWAEERAAREKAKQEAKDAFKSGHFGKVSDKLKNVEFEVMSTRPFAAYDFHGNEITKYVTTMRDDEGHMLTFFASDDLMKERDENGKVLFTSGRIKEHSNYEGQDQTILSHMRAKKKK